MSEIISKAMNSTLGTAKFKAFDELLLDSKSLIPGDDIVIPFSYTMDYWGIYNSDLKVTTTETELASFTMPLSGGIKIRYLIRNNDNKSSSTYTAILRVYVNGTKYSEKSTSISTWNDTPNELVIRANRGDVITIKGQSTRSYTDNSVTYYNFEAKLYDIRYNVIDVPPLLITKAI